ncbi:MAG: hypothetical protein K0R34_3593 [Herbinix sp.]|nr:hypothetical protein [Herbinix sp.]
MYIEIIIENINRIELDDLFYNDLRLEKRLIRTSHFYDVINKEDISIDRISSLSEFYAIDGTGNIYIQEIDLGVIIHNVMIIISFRNPYGDIVLNFEENELLQDGKDIKLSYITIINKFVKIIKEYNIGAVILGYEPAYDEDMKIVTMTKNKLEIIDQKFTWLAYDIIF